MSAEAKNTYKAVIREQECIGCVKCIDACPFDAIIGAANLMHTVIMDECIGCKLCIAPCPVDCIDLVPVETPVKEIRVAQAQQAKNRYQFRKQRLEQQKEISLQAIDKKSYLQGALQRIKNKKVSDTCLTPALSKDETNY